MQYKLMGKTGVFVSQLCMGTMTFGAEADEQTSSALYSRCREVGINHFDCANTYAKGESEKILGRLIHSERDDVIIASKVYFPIGDDINKRGASRKHIKYSVERSLKSLNTDYLDVLYIHRFDQYTDLEETLRTLDDLVSAGKVLYLGASNFSAWQVTKSFGISAHNGWAGFSVLQPMYNLVKRVAEIELLPMAESEELAVFPYSPLGGGLLTGKYNQGARPPESRIARNVMYTNRYDGEWMFDAAEKLSVLAQELGVPTAALAVAWVAANPAVTAPLIGARNLEQLEQSLAALQVDMTDELYEKISGFSVQPPPATDRNEERIKDFYGSR